jgi:mycofactocin precursor
MSDQASAGAVMTPDPPAAADVTVEPASVLERDPAGLDDALVETDLLVEEISIDGMCGVY